MDSMFSLGARLLENPGIDFSNFSGNAGMYVKLMPVKGKEHRAVTDLLLKQFKCPTRPAEFLQDAHVTAIWSKYAVPRSELRGIGEIVGRRFPSRITGATYWPGHGNVGYLVFNVKSDELVNLHDMLVKLGAQHSFATYEPHITIAANVGPLTPQLREWLGQINSSLARKSLPLILSSVTFSDLWE